MQLKQCGITIAKFIASTMGSCYLEVELSDYFDCIKHCDVFFTIVMLMLVGHNRDSYSSFKDP